MSNNNKLWWYRALLKLYPKSYRQEYEEEMLVTVSEMLSEARDNAEKRQLTIRVMKDYMLSLMQQNLYATENTFSEVPNQAKRQLSLSVALVLPFVAVFIYNVINLSIRHVVPLLNFESHTWVIYSVILPIVGLGLTAKTCLGGIYGQIVSGQWREVVRSRPYNLLFLGIFLIYLTVAYVAIF